LTREEAIRLAREFVSANRLAVDGLESADFVTLPIVDEATIPAGTLETYRSVRSKFRDHWVVRFRRFIPNGVTECPETEMICVYESGEVVHSPSI
jgi:hypothetical protein